MAVNGRLGVAYFLSGGLELELELIQTHMKQKPCCGVKWMRVRCACTSDRGWVVQTSAVAAMRLGVGVVSLFGH